MIDFILDQIISPFWPYILGAFGLVATYFTGRSKGAAKVRQKQAEAVAKGVEAGAKGAAKADADLRAGKTPEEIVRGHDDAWR